MFNSTPSQEETVSTELLNRCKNAKNWDGSEISPFRYLDLKQIVDMHNF